MGGSKAMANNLDGSNEPKRLPGVVRATAHAHGWAIVLDVASDLGCLEGHFPDLAIVPGVALIGWAESLAREYLDATGEVRALEQVKFNQLVRPGQQLMLTLSQDPDGAGIDYRFRDPQGERDFASGRLLFTHG